jgi:hypothetical protein
MIAFLLLICSCSLHRSEDSNATEAEVFDLRAKCGQQAHDLQAAELVKSRSNGNIPVLTFIPHYNAGSKRCYLDESGYVGSGATTVRLRRVFDALDRSVIISCQQTRFTGESYGNVSCKSLGVAITEQQAEAQMNALIEQTGEWPFSK